MHRQKMPVFNKTKLCSATSNPQRWSSQSSTPMKPPSDRLLDTSGAGIDLPARARPRYGLRWSVVLGVATLLGILSSALAFSFTRALGRPSDELVSLVVLNGTYWYSGRCLPPSIVWLSQHFRFERQGLDSRPADSPPFGGAVLVRAHRRHGRRAVVARRRDATRIPWWAEVKRSALHELRLGDDDLLGHRGPQPRGPLLPRVARPRAARRPSSRPSSSRRRWPRCSISCSRTSCSTRCTRFRR